MVKRKDRNDVNTPPVCGRWAKKSPLIRQAGSAEAFADSATTGREHGEHSAGRTGSQEERSQGSPISAHGRVERVRKKKAMPIARQSLHTEHGYATGGVSSGLPGETAEQGRCPGLRGLSW